MAKRSGKKPGLLPLEVKAEMAWAERRRRRQEAESDQRLARMLETALRGAQLNAMPQEAAQAALKPRPKVKLPSNLELAKSRPKKDSRSSIGDLLALKSEDVQ